MNKKDETSVKCEICGNPGGSFVMLGEKGSNHADFYWICKHCEKAVRWAFARMDESESEKCQVRRHRWHDKIS